MKKRKLLTLILASMAMGALAGCGGPASSSSSSAPSSASTASESSASTTSQQSSTTTQEELPAEYDISKYWAGNPAEDYYKVVEKTDSTVITYEDVTGEGSGGWCYVGRSFAYDAKYSARFAEYKKISFTGKLEKTSGSDIVMVKVEGNGGTFERRFNFESTVRTYEFSLSFVKDWTQVTQILFFVNRSIKESGNGTITLNKFVLSKEAVNPDYDIASDMPSVPQDYTYYKGEAEKLDVMYRWGYNNEGEIATEEEDSGNFKFTWGGKKSNAYSYVSALVKGDETHELRNSGFKRAVFEVTGTAGVTTIFKFEAKNLGAKEVRTELTGEKQVIEVDITGVLANPDATEYMLLIFPAADVTGENVPAGELVLSACYLDTTAVPVPEVLNPALYPAYFLDKHNKADPCFTVTNSGHVTTVQYTKSAPGWESIEYKLDSKLEDWWNKDFNRLVGNVVANCNVKVLIKAYDAEEVFLDLKANEAQYVDVTFDAAKVDLTKGTYIFMCLEEGNALSGVVTFTDLRLTRPFVNVGYKEDVRLNNVTPTEAYNVRKDEQGNLAVAYEFEIPDFRGLEFLVSADDVTKYNVISGKFTADADTHVIIKPADESANEIKLALKANEEYALEEHFSVALQPMWAKVIVMICTDAGDSLTANVAIKDFCLKIDDPTAVGTGSNVASWSGVYLDQYDFHSDCYTLAKQEDGSINVHFEKKATGGWENIQASINLPETWWNITDYTHFKGTFYSETDVTILIKPFDAPSAEKWFDIKSKTICDVEFDYDSAVCNLEKKFIIFVAEGDQNKTLVGDLVMTDLMITRGDANIENNSRDTVIFDKIGGMPSCYTAEVDELGTRISYTKTADDRWAGIQFFSFARDYSVYKYFYIAFTANENCTVIVKIGDNGANEKTITATAGQTVRFSEAIAVPVDAKWDKSILMVGAGDGELSGSIVLHDFFMMDQAPTD